MKNARNNRFFLVALLILGFCFLYYKWSRQPIRTILMGGYYNPEYNVNVYFRICKLNNNDIRSFILLAKKKNEKDGKYIYISEYGLEQKQLFSLCADERCGLFTLNEDMDKIRILTPPQSCKQFNLDRGNILLISFAPETGFIFSQLRDRKGVVSSLARQIADTKNRRNLKIVPTLAKSYPEINKFLLTSNPAPPLRKNASDKK